MKKSKLMTPYLAGILLLGSLCMGTSVYADEGLQDSVPVLMEETELNQDDAFTDDSSIPDTDEVPTEEEDVSDVEGEPSTDEDDSDENQEESEEPSDTVSVSANELYQGEQTVLEADGFYDEDAEDILHEIFVITVPSELTAGTLTKPVFENAEVTVLIDGEEIESEEEVVNIAQKAKQIGIKVKPVGNILQQMEKLVLTLYNDTSAETESVIKTALHKFFEDGSVDVTDIQRLTVVLKGIKPVSEPDIGTPPEREPEYPEEQEPVEDPGDKPLDPEYQNRLQYSCLLRVQWSVMVYQCTVPCLCNLFWRVPYLQGQDKVCNFLYRNSSILGITDDERNIGMVCFEQCHF